MPDQLEMRVVDQVQDIVPPSGKIIIHTENFTPLVQQSLAQMGTEKAGTAGDQSTLAIERLHGDHPFLDDAEKLRPDQAGPTATAAILP
jgi:hypothetical protein